MRVEVAYALAQQLLVLDLPPGSSVQDALDASGLRQHLSPSEPSLLGVWGRRAAPDTRLRAGDRVEIYRPLLADPKEARKQRVAEGKATKKGGGEAGEAGA